ncbi:RING-type domain-containing protein [Caenorhabditis elegans]|uniref:RING-type domain-containing protein n=1 Tax=Caenorhabditis elegans TaxID=6239 RepID=Q20112_CAEEL|nr:RING-type domain-containing protein [Caenorhabditis elegans]CAA84663.1 RING-type domain-containing protein [Caenorhabditis elegans]|eukprot:NP_497794.1 Uncharacterized protein CELE_F37A8.2 [Caenorhabditis elegans]
MTEFESTENQKPTMLASLDHLSLRNWASPFEEASTPPTSDDSFQSSSEDNLSLRNWAPLSPNPETEKSAKSLRNYSTNPLIPSYICDLCESPKTSELRVAHDAPTFQTTYSYSISWDVEMDDVEHYRNVMETVSKSSAISSRSSFGGAPSPVVVKCDGPCKKEFPSNLLSTIGRCGHYLCTACFDIVKNADGTYGCSSQQCYWKGSSRQESKKYYEKDICRKQRAKALGMKDLGIDVKPASSASSNPIKETSDSSSETNCSLSSGTVSFNHRMLNSLTPVAENSVAIMMVLVEPVEVYGIVHSYVKMSFPLNTNLAKALGAMLHRKKKVLGDNVANGQLYFGFVNDDEKIGMRRIKSNYYDSLMVAEIPKFDDRVVLIFDVGDYVARGFKIYLE